MWYPCTGGDSQNPGPLLLFLVMAGHQASGPVQVCQEVSSGADRREQIPGKAEGGQTLPWRHKSHPGTGHHRRGAQPGAGGGTPGGETETSSLRQRWLSRVCPAPSSAPRAFPESGEHKSGPVLGQPARRPRQTPHSLRRQPPLKFSSWTSVPFRLCFS